MAGGLTGIGFVLNNDGLVDVDLDHCVKDGVPDPAALALFDGLGATYVEVSPSGTELRALGYETKLTTGCKGKADDIDVELYSTGRYLTMTGATIKAGPLVLLRNFEGLADRIRVDRKVNQQTGQIVTISTEEKQAVLIQRILTVEVYHDSLRDLSAAWISLDGEVFSIPSF